MPLVFYSAVPWQGSVEDRRIVPWSRSVGLRFGKPILQISDCTYFQNA